MITVLGFAASLLHIKGASCNVADSVVGDISCTICFDDIDGKNEIVLECQHRYHGECIERWIDKNRSCPQCRNIVMMISKQKARKYANLGLNYFMEGFKNNSKTLTTINPAGLDLQALDTFFKFFDNFTEQPIQAAPPLFPEVELLDLIRIAVHYKLGNPGWPLFAHHLIISMHNLTVDDMNEMLLHRPLEKDAANQIYQGMLTVLPLVRKVNARTLETPESGPLPMTQIACMIEMLCPSPSIVISECDLSIEQNSQVVERLFHLRGEELETLTIQKCVLPPTMNARFPKLKKLVLKEISATETKAAGFISNAISISTKISELEIDMSSPKIMADVIEQLSNIRCSLSKLVMTDLDKAYIRFMRVLSNVMDNSVNTLNSLIISCSVLHEKKALMLFEAIRKQANLEELQITGLNCGFVPPMFLDKLVNLQKLHLNASLIDVDTSMGQTFQVFRSMGKLNQLRLLINIYVNTDCNRIQRLVEIMNAPPNLPQIELLEIGVQGVNRHFTNQQLEQMIFRSSKPILGIIFTGITEIASPF